MFLLVFSASGLTPEQAKTMDQNLEQLRSLLEAEKIARLKFQLVSYKINVFVFEIWNRARKRVRLCKFTRSFCKLDCFGVVKYFVSSIKRSSLQEE